MGFGIKTLLISAQDCHPFENYIENGKEACTKIAINAKIAAKKLQSVKTVIIVAYYPSNRGFDKLNLRNIAKENFKETQQEMYVNGYKNLILDLISIGKNVVFIIDNPRLEYDPKRCFSRPLRIVAEDCKISRKVVFESQSVYRQKIFELQKEIPQLKIFDSIGVFCDENFCYGKDDKNIFYFDKQHLSISGSRKLFESMVKNGY